jgi:serine/threonine-protein kinase
MDSTPVQPGEVLAERYVVERVLGSGGMGVVVSAVHRTLGERVAIKFLLDSSKTEPVVVERFLREARATARLRSEHAVRVTDVGTLGNGAPYMVMEFLEGNDAAYELDCRGALPVADAVEYVLQACEALAEAHSLGIVHRDLKPANLFLTDRPGGFRVVKVIDFGIAKSTESASSLTTTSSTMGSPMYMSPEQIRNAKNVDPRSDVWSLGVTCYELLTARLPFRADSVHGTLASIIADPPAPLREAHPELPVQLEAALAPCFEKDRNRRYSDVAALARALAPFGGEAAAEHVRTIESVLRASPGRQRLASTSNADAATLVDTPLTPVRDVATVIEPLAPPLRSNEGRTIVEWTQTSLPPRRRVRPAVLLSAALASVVAAGALFMSRSRPEHVVVQAPSSASRAASIEHVVAPPAATGAPPPPSSAPEPPPVSARAPDAPATTKAAARTKKARAKPAASVSAAPAGPVTIEGRKF